MLPEHAVHSSLPTHLDTSAPPLNAAALLASSGALTTRFRVAAKLPSFMSEAECNAVHVLSTSLAHRSEDTHATAATKAIAAAYKSLFKRSIGKQTKQRIAAYLKNDAAHLSNEERLAIAMRFKQTFNKADWPSTALRYADAWQDAMRCSRSDAEAWSAYLYLQAACGAFESDPQFVEHITSAVGGIGGGVARKYDALDSLVDKVHELSATRTSQDVAAVARATLLQATHSAEADGEAILKHLQE